MPAVVPESPTPVPGSPPAFVPEGGEFVPGVSPGVVPETPEPFPGTPPSEFPETPALPEQPGNYARRGAQNLTADDRTAWRSGLRLTGDAPVRVACGVYSPSGPATGNAAVYFMFNEPDARRGAVVSVTFYSGAGDMKFYRVRQNPDLTVTVLDVFDHTTGGVGNHTLLVERGEFPAWNIGPGEAIAVYGITASQGYGNGVNGAGSWRYTNATPPVVGETIPTGAQPDTGIAQDAGTNNLLQYELATTVRLPVDECALAWVPRIESMRPQWSNAGGWSFNGAAGYAQSTAEGFDQRLVMGPRTGIDRRRIEVEFSLDAADAVLAILTTPNEGVNDGSAVQINGALGRLQIMNEVGAGTGETRSVIAYVPLLSALVAGRKYLFRWEKNGRTYTATVLSLSGSVIATITRRASPLGYSTPPAYGYDQGAMEGALSVAAVDGSAKVHAFREVALCRPDPVWLFLGDSVTTGFGVPDDLKYVGLVAADLGPEQVAASGIGGAVSAGAFDRLMVITTTMRPQNVLIYLGTNSDGSLAANLGKMVRYLRARGINVYVATVPTSAGATAAVNALPAWVTKVPFDVALTASGAGSSLRAEMYDLINGDGSHTNDGLHPGVLGMATMFATLKSSAPEAF